MKSLYLVLLYLLAGSVTTGPVLSMAASCPRRVLCCACRVAFCPCRAAKYVADGVCLRVCCCFDLVRSIPYMRNAYTYDYKKDAFDVKKLTAWKILLERALKYIETDEVVYSEEEITFERMKVMLGREILRAINVDLALIRERLSSRA